MFCSAEPPSSVALLPKRVAGSQDVPREGRPTAPERLATNLVCRSHSAPEEQKLLSLAAVRRQHHYDGDMVCSQQEQAATVFLLHCQVTVMLPFYR